MGSHRRQHIESLESRVLLTGELTPQLVRDLAPGGLNPDDLVVANNRLFFSVTDDVAGRELWTSDGTAAGTYRVRDIRRGGAGSAVKNLIAFDNAVWFSADDRVKPPSWGAELWRSDGTATGTVKVPIFTNDGSRPQRMQVLNGSLYFWSPAEEGSRLVSESVRLDHPAKTAPVMTKLGFAHDLTAVGSRFYYGSFYGSNQNGGPYWTLSSYVPATNTARGVKQIKRMDHLANLGGTLYFAGDNGQGLELWTSDATAAGTVMVKDIRPGLESSDLSGLTTHNGTLYFAANDGTNGTELWRSDGTAEGTYLLKDIHSGVGDSYPASFTTVGNNLFFVADDGSGLELWKTDGTRAGTVRVMDIRPGSAGSIPINLRSANGLLYFAANDGASGYELWKSDGTPAGTMRVADVVSGRGGSHPAKFVTLRKRVYFVAWASGGWELWRTDGTSRGTRRVTRFPGSLSASSDPASKREVNGVAVFSSTNEFGTTYWSSDGNAAGTEPISSFALGIEGPADPYWKSNWLPTPLRVGNKLFYAQANTLHVSDGSTAGTRIYAQVDEDWYVREFKPLSDTMYLWARTDHETALWQSDGTRGGTKRITVISETQLDHNHGEPLLATDGTFYFFAGSALYRTDGTVAGTIRLGYFPHGWEREPRMVEAGGIIFILYDDGISQYIARSDGTPEGSYVLRELGSAPQGSLSPYISTIATVGGFAIFAGDNSRGQELWRSDGTVAGTGMLKDIYEGGDGSDPMRFTAYRGRVYFSARHPSTGYELYETDGTSDGTRLLKDINPGAAGSEPKGLAVAGGNLLFTALHPAHGRELWKLVEPARISGVIFNDADRDGRLETGEQRLAGFRVFIDSNRNGRWDSSELFTRTNDRGEYSLEIEAGLVQVGVTPVSGYAKTTANPVFVMSEAGRISRKHFGQVLIN